MDPRNTLRDQPLLLITAEAGRSDSSVCLMGAVPQICRGSGLKCSGRIGNGSEALAVGARVHPADRFPMKAVRL